VKMKILYKLIKYISITALVTLFLTVGQFGQFMRSSNDVRKHALEDWAGADQKRQEQVAEFTQACLVGKKSQERDFKKQWNSKRWLPELSIKVCAEKNDWTQLYEVVSEADSILQTTAWPLSLLAKS
jgi:hypothetical protein